MFQNFLSIKALEYEGAFSKWRVQPEVVKYVTLWSPAPHRQGLRHLSFESCRTCTAYLEAFRDMTQEAVPLELSV